jgi:hypothetical protein
LLAEQAGGLSSIGIIDPFDPDGGELGPLAPGAGPDGEVPVIALCDVGGIVVNCLIADQFRDMVAHAARDHVALTGSGYRSASEQIALRKAHCGTSHDAIYEMSPGSCRPPTARPGESLHEIGLAIDFDTARTRGTAAFGWLATHAATYGFYNLPSEPWHWSTTGS